MAKRRRISFTEITKALSCSAQWDFSYGGRLAGSTLKSRELRATLSNGRAWGAGVAFLHAHSASPLRALYASDAITAALLADADESAERGFAPDLADVVGRAERLSLLVERYVEVAPLFDNLTHIEGEIVVPIPGVRMDFQCFLDGYTVSGHWGRRLVEFKLRGALQDAVVVELARQPRWYAWAFRELLRSRGLANDLDGVFIDEMLNELPKAPRVVRAGKESPALYLCPREFCNAGPNQPCIGARGPLKTFHPERRDRARMTYGPSHAKDQITTAEMYVAVCAQHGVTVNEDTREALAARQWHQRIPLTYTPDELDEAGEELKTAARAIRGLDSGATYPIRNAKPGQCRVCDFFKVCAHPEDSLLVDSLFVRGLPKRVR